MHNASAPSVPGTPSQTARPPSREGSSAPPGTADSRTRPTVWVRPVVTVERMPCEHDCVDATDVYVRRFWIPLLGPGAVADLLRLTAAAQSGRPLRLPTHTHLLTTHGLVQRLGDHRLAVRPKVPRLSAMAVRRLPPSIRRDHQVAMRTGTVPRRYPAGRGHSARDIA